MATMTENPDGTFTLTCTPAEQDTLSGLPDGQLAGYITLWLEGRAGSILQERFARLTLQQQTTMMTTLKQSDPVKASRP